MHVTLTLHHRGTRLAREEDLRSLSLQEKRDNIRVMIPCMLFANRIVLVCVGKFHSNGLQINSSSCKMLFRPFSFINPFWRIKI